MARIKNGINGSFTGKIGGVVGVSYGGEDYARGVPRKSSKPATPAQLKQREKFGLIKGWLRPLLELINIGFKALVKGNKTAMNAAVSYHMKHVVKEEDGALNIDFSKAVFSRGELMISFILEVLRLVGNVISIRWTDGNPSPFCNGEDRANFVFYNPSKQQFISYEGVALRKDGEVQLQLPADFAGDLLHGWMGYVSDNDDMVSTSSYLGELS